MSETLTHNPAHAETIAHLGRVVAERLAVPNTISVATEIEHGLPITTLERVAADLAPTDANFAYRFVPRATLARRRAALGGRLSTDESARVIRVAAVWSLTREVWRDDETARRFLFTPHAMLTNRPPIDIVLASEFGRPLVEEILGGLLHGTAV